MKPFAYCLLLTALFVFGTTFAQAQPQPVPKTYTKPVLMHYMPWFDTPEYTGSFWGWHWKMNTMDPDSIDPQTQKRQIAAHFYPLIGPYDSEDPDVIEYHLLLMKYSGIDGILIDWYGVQGTNGDINSLLNNSNALIAEVPNAGLKFGVVMEDRFSDTVPNGQANMAYLRDNYFNDSAYFRYGPNTDPLVGIFGPITFEDTLDWDSIMPYAGEDIEFLTLWYQKGDAGQHADGEYAWIYEVDSLNDHLTRQENFYKNRAPNLKTAMALAYPGFDDFYAQGGAGSSLFTIPHDSGATLDSVLLRVGQNDSVIDLLQLATWNDFGEGTMFEPTCEFGYEFLTRLQDFLGVPYGEYELTQIKRLYDLRQDYENDSLTQLALDRVFDHFVALEDSDAVWLMDSIEGLLVSLESNSMRDIKVFPNPASDILYIEGEFSPAARFYFVDLVGRRMELAINENRLNLQGVNPGVYVLRIEDGLKTLSIRVIIE